MRSGWDGMYGRFGETAGSQRMASESQRGAAPGSQRGAALFVVLVTGVVLCLVLGFVAWRAGESRKDSVKTMKATREFYLADAGFNYVKTRVSLINRSDGAAAVRTFLAGQRAAGWQPIGLGGAERGVFRLSDYTMTEAPLTVEFEVQGARKAEAKPEYESVKGVLRVPSLARYARYVEGNSQLTYSAGTVVDGEILVAGGITLAGSTVRFTRMVATGEEITNRPYGRYDFGFREKQKDIPTLNHVHVNSWDNHKYDASLFRTTFEYYARNGGVYLFGDDPVSRNPAWNSLNDKRPCSSDRTGPCDTLFTGCYDTLSAVRRSPVVVVGSAVAIDLSQVKIVGGNVEVTVNPVIYDAGGDGKDYFTLGTPARVYRRPLAGFKTNAILYFPGDIYLTGQLRSVPLTVASGDDIFLYGSMIGPAKTEVDANQMPVTLGIVAQDRVYIHESSSRDLTIRAAVLAENDEIIYDDAVGGPNWRYGYVCRREIFATPPAKGATVPLAAYFKEHFIWDDGRVAQTGFGREPEEECLANGTCPNRVLETYGFAALAYPRTGGARWRLNFEGSLITRQPGSKGPRDKCDLGWDCSQEPERARWNYDDNLGVAAPPRFPAPVVDDRNPTQILGFKRKSHGKAAP